MASAYDATERDPVDEFAITGVSCLTNLLENGLIRLSGDDSQMYRPTADGLALLRKADL